MTIIARALPAIMAPAVILGGLVSGLFTVTETGVAACVYSLFVSVFVYRELTWREFRSMLQRSVLSSALVMFMIGTGTIMAYLVTWDQSLLDVARWFTALPGGPTAKLLIINLFLLLVGALVEAIPAMLILIPVLLPIAVGLGVDPIHFGIIMNFNLLLGLVHPPLGLALFVVSNISGLTVEAVTRATLPFLIPLLSALLIITYVPSLSTWLPNLLMSK
jgi:tripartite ATP-independent transporter DctM subunit